MLQCMEWLVSGALVCGVASQRCCSVGWLVSGAAVCGVAIVSGAAVCEWRTLSIWISSVSRLVIDNMTLDYIIFRKYFLP